jgi:hypothetical protein
LIELRRPYSDLANVKFACILVVQRHENDVFGSLGSWQVVDANRVDCRKNKVGLVTSDEWKGMRDIDVHGVELPRRVDEKRSDSFEIGPTHNE